MTFLLIAALIILMGLTLYTLLRGLNAFRQSIDANVDPEAAKALQLKQNKMMMNRILFQGAAIVIVALILITNS